MNTKPITASTETMFQWMMRPTTRFATTATASTTATAIAANATEPPQPRFCSACDFDLDSVFASVLARTPLPFFVKVSFVMVGIISVRYG